MFSDVSDVERITPSHQDRPYSIRDMRLLWGIDAWRLRRVVDAAPISVVRDSSGARLVKPADLAIVLEMLQSKGWLPKEPSR